METSKRLDSLWKICGRIDEYIRSVNSKASVIASLDVFILGSILLQLASTLDSFSGFQSQFLAGLTIGAMIIAALATTVSLVAAFLSVKPFLKSIRKASKYQSVIFFRHISEDDSPEDYLHRFEGLGEEDLLRDLGAQIHALAKGADYKFNCLYVSVWGILGGLVFFVPAFIILTFLK